MSGLSKQARDALRNQQMRVRGWQSSDVVDAVLRTYADRLRTDPNRRQHRDAGRPAACSAGDGTPARKGVDPRMQPTPLTVEIWSDVACPWCYIGKRLSL